MYDEYMLKASFVKPGNYIAEISQDVFGQDCVMSIAEVVSKTIKARDEALYFSLQSIDTRTIESISLLGRRVWSVEKIDEPIDIVYHPNQELLVFSDLDAFINLRHKLEYL